MPLIDENLKTENFNQQAQATNAFPTNQVAPKGLFQIPENFLRLIPWIPIGLEMLTGQKIPATGILADIWNGIQQVQFNLQQVLTQQQQLRIELKALENNASQQLTNLSQQLNNTNNNFKVLATETKRSLELIHQPTENN